MEYMVTRSDNELQHHGTKGMKWGRRLYQNKDGSLTPLGQKRYNKEVEKLKKETAKVKEAEKNAATRKKTQAKFDKLEAEKQKLEARKKALKDGTDKQDDDQPTETVEQRREKALNSTDPKEVYKNKDVLSYQELNERVNRIDLENRLQSKIPVEEPPKSHVDQVMERVNKGVALYKSVDNAYSAVANSAIGKTLAKKLGMEVPKKEFDLDDFVKNMSKKSAAEVKETNERLKNENAIKDEFNRRKNKEKADADYAKKEAEEKKAAKAREKEAKKNAKEAEREENNRQAESNKNTKSETEYTETDSNVYGKGTSKFTGWDKNTTTVDAEEGKDFWSVDSDAGKSKMSDVVDNRYYSIGQTYIAGLLELKE